MSNVNAKKLSFIKMYRQITEVNWVVQKPQFISGRQTKILQWQMSGLILINLVLKNSIEGERKFHKDRYFKIVKFHRPFLEIPRTVLYETVSGDLA